MTSHFNFFFSLINTLFITKHSQYDYTNLVNLKKKKNSKDYKLQKLKF